MAKDVSKVKNSKPKATVVKPEKRVAKKVKAKKPDTLDIVKDNPALSKEVPTNGEQVLQEPQGAKKKKKKTKKSLANVASQDTGVNQELKENHAEEPSNKAKTNKPTKKNGDSQGPQKKSSKKRTAKAALDSVVTDQNPVTKEVKDSDQYAKTMLPKSKKGKKSSKVPSVQQALMDNGQHSGSPVPSKKQKDGSKRKKEPQVAVNKQQEPGDGTKPSQTTLAAAGKDADVQQPVEPNKTSEQHDNPEPTQPANQSFGPQQGKFGSASNAFRRVRAEDWLHRKGAWNNSYTSTFGEKGWGYKAQEVLGTVRGKDFRHEKTKKKRGTYRGGLIDVGAVNSHKFASDDEDS